MSRFLVIAAVFGVAVQGCTPDSSVTYEEDDRLVVATTTTALTGGLSERVSIDVPVGIESLLIEVSGQGGYYFLTEMVTPSGRDLVEAAVLVTRVAREIPGYVSWQYPANEVGGIDAGPYQLLVRAENRDGSRLEEDSLTMSVYMRKSETVAQCILPLDFIVATDAIAEEDVDESIERLAIGVSEFFAPANVQIPQYGVSRVHFPTMTVEEEGDLGETAIALGSILADALSNDRAREEALHVFIVRSMGTGLNGYSMGLPGPASGDWPSSGVLVSTTSFATGNVLSPEMMSVSTAHEIGHYLGLYHTSERDTFHDPIADTPECDRAGFCTDEAFARNLMTPGGSPDRYIVTPGQGAVIRRHPLCQ